MMHRWNPDPKAPSQQVGFVVVNFKLGNNMNYEQTLEWMFRQLPMYQNKGADALNFKLDKTKAVCAYLNDPHNQFKSIHVGGTNGKGSSSHMLAAVLQKAGYKTGLYTSPHLKDFRERIKINGEMIPEAYVLILLINTSLISSYINCLFLK